MQIQASSVFRLRSLVSLCLVVTLLGIASWAQAQSFTIGSGDVATADPVVPRPPTKPCTVTLFSNQQFVNYDAKPFNFTPAAECAGPWQKVVLSVDYSITGTNQFDRTAQIWLGGAIIYFGTTQEPSIAPPGSTSWHIERDLTDYSALFAQPQVGHADLGNFVGTDNGVVYDGVITGTATLNFYTVVGGLRQGALQSRPDTVLSMNADPTNGAGSVSKSSDQYVANFVSLPTNIERAYLDVYAQGQGGDEFWYFDLPDDIAPIFQDSGNTAFKETQITIDGQPAGIAPIFPWVFTGGADPILWRPTPGVQTLAFEAYRVDLTPFAGTLNDGKPHSVAVGVYNSSSSFTVAANLMLYLDHGSSIVTGSLISNNLSLTPTVDVKDDISVVTDPTDNSVQSAMGTTLVTSNRKHTIVGSVQTSHGLVTTQIDTTIGFSSNQKLATTDTQYVQDAVQNTQIDMTTTRVSGDDIVVVHEQRAYPLTFDYEINVAADGTQTNYVNVDQEFQQQVDVGVQGAKPTTAVRDNHVLSTVTRNYAADGTLTSAPSTAGQLYTYSDPYAACYSREVDSQNRKLTGVFDGDGCIGGRNLLSWRDRYSQNTSNLYGATIQLLP